MDPSQHNQYIPRSSSYGFCVVAHLHSLLSCKPDSLRGKGSIMKNSLGCSSYVEGTDFRFLPDSVHIKNTLESATPKIFLGDHLGWPTKEVRHWLWECYLTYFSVFGNFICFHLMNVAFLHDGLLCCFRLSVSAHSDLTDMDMDMDAMDVDVNVETEPNEISHKDLPSCGAVPSFGSDLTRMGRMIRLH